MPLCLAHCAIMWEGCSFYEDVSILLTHTKPSQAMPQQECQFLILYQHQQHKRKPLPLLSPSLPLPSCFTNAKDTKVIKRKKMIALHTTIPIDETLFFLFLLFVNP